VEEEEEEEEAHPERPPHVHVIMLAINTLAPPIKRLTYPGETA